MMMVLDQSGRETDGPDLPERDLRLPDPRGLSPDVVAFLRPDPRTRRVLALPSPDAIELSPETNIQFEFEFEA